LAFHFLIFDQAEWENTIASWCAGRIDDVLAARRAVILEFESSSIPFSKRGKRLAPRLFRRAGAAHLGRQPGASTTSNSHKARAVSYSTPADTKQLEAPNK